MTEVRLWYLAIWVWAAILAVLLSQTSFLVALIAVAPLYFFLMWWRSSLVRDQKMEVKTWSEVWPFKKFAQSDGDEPGERER